jgi:hypothetical protein
LMRMGQALVSCHQWALRAAVAAMGWRAGVRCSAVGAWILIGSMRGQRKQLPSQALAAFPTHRALCLWSAVAGGVGLAHLAPAATQACVDAAGGATGIGDCALIVGRGGCACDCVGTRHVGGAAGVRRTDTAALAAEGGGGAAVDKVCGGVGWGASG